MRQRRAATAGASRGHPKSKEKGSGGTKPSSKSPSYPRVEVEWADACLEYNYEGPITGAGGLSMNRRMGYLIGKRKDDRTGLWYILLAHELVEDHDAIREPMSIPAGWITNITELEAGKSHGKKRR